MKTFRYLAFLLGWPALLGVQPPQDWKQATPEYSWEFPEDHWARRGYKTEWWYITGQLRMEDGDRSRFGYQFTFFRVGLMNPEPHLESEWSSGTLIMGHAAITDLLRQEHFFSEVIYREVPFLGGFNDYPDPRIAWSIAPPGTDGKWTLDWNGSAFDLSMRDDRRGMGLNLSTKPEKPLVFQGPEGYSRKSSREVSGSLYYSFTRLATTGTVTVDGVAYDVRGTSWMDKEFSSGMLGREQVGWDWFSIQLEDGTDIMLYRLRNRSGETGFASGTIVNVAGDVRYLGSEEWRSVATSWWTSPESGARYPVGWKVEIPSYQGRLEIFPVLPDQENRSRLIPGLNYWEGAVQVRDASGAEIGRGYVELTGYQENGRLPL